MIVTVQMLSGSDSLSLGELWNFPNVWIVFSLFKELIPHIAAKPHPRELCMVNFCLFHYIVL